jgi:MOSC domain-containing protein YiiM/ribosomal protein S18 acetylase RimI-like enzyme
VTDGRLLHINVSGGGVPKRPVAVARITALGVEGDRQREVTVHGGPHRAVSILGIEAIRRVAAEGNPIAPGTTGENLTTEGFDVSLLPVGTRLAIGEAVVLELAGTADPCRTIRHSFRDLRFGRLGAAAHPGDSRMYARVLQEGTVRPGDAIRISPPPDDRADRFVVAARLDRAVRSACVSLWGAAVDGGAPVAILDDGEIAAAASPALPGRTFNQAIGFAHLPNLVPIAVDHFRAHGATGWVWAEEPPWPGALPEDEAVHAVAPTAEVTRGTAPDGLLIRELGRDEVGDWAEVMIVANEMGGRFADAWRAMERRLALAPHDHRFIGEVDGRPVAAGALHTHHGVGYLRAGSVLPTHRRRGIQRAMLEARVAHAGRIGCELVGSVADVGSSSARNLERIGLRVAAIRGAYRIDGGG